MVKNRYGHSRHGTLKLSVFQEWMDGKNYFLCVDTTLGKLKGTAILFRWFWSKMGIVFSGLSLKKGSRSTTVSHNSVYALDPANVEELFSLSNHVL